MNKNKIGAKKKYGKLKHGKLKKKGKTGRMDQRKKNIRTKYEGNGRVDKECSCGLTTSSIADH